MSQGQNPKPTKNPLKMAYRALKAKFKKTPTPPPTNTIPPTPTTTATTTPPPNNPNTIPNTPPPRPQPTPWVRVNEPTQDVPRRPQPQPQPPQPQLQTPPTPTRVDPMVDEKPKVEILEKFELEESDFSEESSDLSTEQVEQLSKRGEQAVKQFKVGMASPKLDSSDLILQAMQVLGYVLGKAGKSALDSVSRMYQSHDYTGAIDSLIQLAEEGGKQVDPEIVSLLRSKRKDVKDDPEANESRRFFETRMASLLEKSMETSGSFQSVQGLSEAMSQYRVNLPPVTDMKSAQQVLLTVARFNDNIEMELKKGSPKYQAKDRAERPTHGSDSEDHDERLSRNTGVMKANAPNFTDSVQSRDQKNRVPDRNTLDTSKDEGFSATHEDVPFVASISGTSFSLVKLLEGFMSANAKDPQLTKKVNDIVKMFIATYVKMGFHSYGEMMHVLEERNIQKLFTRFGVTVDLTLPPDVLETATKDAEDYARTNSVKSSMHEELKSKVAETPEHVSAYTLLMQGKLATAEKRPNQYYVVFGTPKDRQAAIEQITKEFGDKSFRVANIKNAIEVFPPLFKLLGIKPPPTPTEEKSTPEKEPPTTEKVKSETPVKPEQSVTTDQKTPPEDTKVVEERKPPEVQVIPEGDALKLLRKGKVVTFNDRPNKVYVLFKSDDERTLATNALDNEYGSSSYRVTIKQGMIEIFSDLQGLLGL